MKRKLTDALDDCLRRIRAGADIDACLAEYAELEPELRPMLEIALSLEGLRQVTPSPKFVDHAWSNIRVRIAENTAAPRSRRNFGLSIFNRQALRLAVSITMALVLVATTALFFPGGPLAPQKALASDCTLSIIGGSVTVTPDGARTSTGRDGMKLATGDTVTTDADSYALLTFGNGSTLKLEPLTAVKLEAVTINPDGATGDVVLQQTEGQTWSSVENVAPGFSYMVMTPSAVAEVIGTQFVTQVGEDGDTVVQTARGQVDVSAQGATVSVPAGSQSQISAGAAPAAAALTPPPDNQLTLVFAGSVIGSVTDPSGSGTGYLANGYPFNQIQGSAASLGDGEQSISIPDPQSGEYKILIYGVGDGVANIGIQGTHLGATAFSNVNVVRVNEGNAYVITLQITAGEDNFDLTDVESAQPARGQAKPKVVVPPGLVDEDKTPPGQEDKDNPSQSDEDKTPPGQEDKDNPGQGNEDNTPPGQEDKDNPGQGNEDKTPPGQEDKDNPGQGNEDKTPPGQEDSGDPSDDPGNTPPGQNKDKDKKPPPGQDQNT